MDIKYDTHLHSYYSTDSDTPVSAQVEKAILLLAKGITITDHMDYDFPADACDIDLPDDKRPFEFDIKEYKEELNKLKKDYEQIELRIGVECGLQKSPSVLIKNQALATDPDLDQVIGSLHLVDGKDPYYPIFWAGYSSPGDAIKTYFESYLENIKLFSDFDTLGHLDYIVRYAPKGYVYDPYEYMDIVDAIFDEIIRHDIALEINTSPLKNNDLPNPHPIFLSRYIKKGGKLITIGSDAHTPEYLFDGFSTIEDILVKEGINHYVIFDKRKPKLIGI